MGTSPCVLIALFSACWITNVIHSLPLSEYREQKEAYFSRSLSFGLLCLWNLCNADEVYFFLIHSDNTRLLNRFNCASGGNRWRIHRYSHDHCIVLCHFKHLYNVVFLSMLQDSHNCYQIHKESSIQLLRIVAVCKYMIDMHIKQLHDRHTFWIVAVCKRTLICPHLLGL